MAGKRRQGMEKFMGWLRLAADKHAVVEFLVPMTPELEPPRLHVFCFGGLARPAMKSSKKLKEPREFGHILQVHLGNLLESACTTGASPESNVPRS